MTPDHPCLPGPGYVVRCPACGHPMADHGMNSYGDVCLIEMCPCPDDYGYHAMNPAMGGPDDGALEYPHLNTHRG